MWPKTKSSRKRNTWEHRTLLWNRFVWPLRLRSLWQQLLKSNLNLKPNLRLRLEYNSHLNKYESWLKRSWFKRLWLRKQREWHLQTLNLKLWVKWLSKVMLRITTEWVSLCWMELLRVRWIRLDPRTLYVRVVAIRRQWPRRWVKFSWVKCFRAELCLCMLSPLTTMLKCSEWRCRKKIRSDRFIRKLKFKINELETIRDSSAPIATVFFRTTWALWQTLNLSCRQSIRSTDRQHLMSRTTEHKRVERPELKALWTGPITISIAVSGEFACE